jgi:hypothetical protein
MTGTREVSPFLVLVVNGPFPRFCGAGAPGFEGRYRPVRAIQVDLATSSGKARSWRRAAFAPQNSARTRPSSEPKFNLEINGQNLLTDFEKSTGLENTRPEKPRSTPCLRRKVNSPAATTLENNGNFRPRDRAENGLGRGVGWPKRSGSEPSLRPNGLILLEVVYEEAISA